MKKYYPQFLLSLSLLASPFAMANNNCVQLQKQAKHAYKQHNLKQLQITHNSMKHARNCISSQKDYVARQLAHGMYDNLVKKKVQKQALVNGMRRILQIYNDHWPALVSLADYYHDMRNFNQSANYYSMAIDAINNEVKTPKGDVPPLSLLKRLQQSSELDLLAADRPPVASKGDGDGIMALNIRSSRAIKKLLPIHFNSGKNTLRGNDLAYAKRLYHALHRKGEPNITLIGHTDPVGKREMNLRLSKARAKAVKQFLLARGYKGRIKSGGKGEDQKLYDPRDNAKRFYGEKRWYRMLRRVEMFIK